MTVMIMKGRCVFAKFMPFAGFDGEPLSRLRDGRAFPDAARAKALAVAIAQIERAAHSHAVSA